MTVGPVGRCDIVLAGGTVVDGTGAPGFAADVGVADGRIVAVAPPGTVVGDEVLDCAGLVVAPGFIDVHAHDDRVAVDDPAMAAKSSQGVTTVVAGNCGISLAPLDRSVAGGPLPAPFDLLGDDADYRYPTLAARRAALDAARPAVNVALLVGHTSLRVAALGVDAAVERPADPEEVAAMRVALARALDEGAVGLSSGVDYPPAAPAGIDELAAVAGVLADHPGAVYATHVRDESDGVVDAVAEAIDTAERAGVPLLLSHHKCAGPANYGRSGETLALVDEARRGPTAGIALDVYPYTASQTSLFPQFVAHSESVLVAWSTPHPECGGRTLDEVADGWGCSLDEAVDRLQPAGAVYFQIDEDDLRRILAHPAAMVGSDGLPGRERPHPRLWGTFPRVLGRYVRDQGLLPLEQAVHKMTGLPATTFSMDGPGGRGRVAEGMAADLVAFDPATVADRGTFDDPERESAGIHHVLVAGVPTRVDGAATGDRAGGFLPRRR